jgi:hypothetical protein
MIACASPSSGDTLETLSTLTYASRARGITNRVIVNKDHEAATISQLKSRITSLETELAEYKKVCFMEYSRMYLILGYARSSAALYRSEQPK